MNTFLKYAVVVIGTVNIAGLTQAKSSFEAALENMHKSFQELEQEMNKSFQESFTSMKDFSSQANVTFEEKAGHMLITARNIETDKVDATINDDATNLLVKAGHDTLSIMSDRNALSIELHHKQEDKKKDKDGKEYIAGQSTRRQAFSLLTSMPALLDSPQLKVDYDKAQKVLTIEIPLASKDHGRKAVPVSMK